MMETINGHGVLESSLVTANSGASRRGSSHGTQRERDGMAASVCAGSAEKKRPGKLQLPSSKRGKENLVRNGCDTAQATVPKDEDEAGFIRENVLSALGRSGRHFSLASTSETEEPSSNILCNKKRKGEDCRIDGSDLEYGSSQGNIFIRSRSRPVFAKRSKFVVAPCRTNHLGVATTLPSDVDVDLDLDTDPEQDAGGELVGELIEGHSQYEMSDGQQAAHDMMAIFLPTLPQRRNRPVVPEPTSISDASPFHRVSTRGDVGPAMNEGSTASGLLDKVEGSTEHGPPQDDPSALASLHQLSVRPWPEVNRNCMDRSSLYEDVVRVDKDDSAKMRTPASVPRCHPKELPTENCVQLGQQRDQQAFAVAKGVHPAFSTTGSLQSEIEARLMKQIDEQPAREQDQALCNNGKLQFSSNLRAMGEFSVDDCIGRKAEGSTGQSTTMHTGDDPQVQPVEWWTTDLNPEDLYSSQELLEVVAGCVGKDRYSKQGSENPHDKNPYVPQDLESVCVSQLPASKDLVRSPAPQCIGHFVCPSPVVFLTLRVGQDAIQLCVGCASGEEKSRRLFVFRSENSASGDIEFDLVTSFTLAIKSSLVKEGQGLLFTPDGKGIMMLDFFGLPNTRHCAPYGHGLHIVAFNNKEVWLQAMLRCSTGMRCLIAPEPLVVIAAGTSGHVNCWVMDTSWKFCQEAFNLPSKGLVTSTIIELLMVPRSRHYIVGCTSEGMFAVWDYRQRVLLKLFGSPQPDFILLTAHLIDFVPSPPANEDGANCWPPPNVDFCFLVCTSAKFDDGDHTERFQNTESRRLSCCYAAVAGDEVFLSRPLNDRASASSTIGSCAIIGTEDGEAYAVDVLRGEKLLQFLELKGSRITSVAADQSVGIFATASKDGRVSVYSSMRIHS